MIHCIDCAYYHKLPRANMGRCRLHPPVSIVHGDWSLPPVDDDDWCGQAKRKESLSISRPRSAPTTTGWPPDSTGAKDYSV